MKRLTSILAISVITVMTASAARADIASVSYVNEKADAITAAAEMKSNKVTNTTDFSADATSTEKYPSMAVANEMAKQAASLVGADISDLESKVDDMDTAYKAADTKLQGNIDKKQDILNSGTGGNVTVSGTGNVVTGITADGKGNVTITKEATVATSETVNALTARVGTAETNIKGLQDGKQSKLSDTQMAAVNSGITAAKVTTYDGYDATIKSNTSGVSAINTKIGTVPTGKTVVGMISEAQSAATYDDTTVKANIKALQDTGVTKALVDQITTNKNDIAANKTSIAGKVSTAQGADAANKALITNASGGVTTGQIATGMIANDAVTTVKILDKNVTKAKLASDVQTSLGKADTALQAADITNKITAPGTAAADITSDGTYTLTMKVVNNVKTYAWEKIGR